MSLRPGTRLGSYEILAAIGAGGMGEVYRATDTSLKRQVAIKVLPASVAADADRLARFQREAEVLAQLNHPNIAAIYGLEQSGATSALVMELVEGPTLAERIAQGAIPVDEALPMARQIADALKAAHAQGIVHRDLKPANIKVRRDGTVKVLDFGLAKAIDEPKGSSPQGLENSPTITTPAMTQVGTILGTAAYMSPEQAEGKSVDRRSDIFSFGAVLYEMVTGRRAFGGDSMAQVVSSVLRDEPPAPGGPAAVAEAIRRCLKKRPDDRFASMADVHAALNAAATSASTASEQPSIAVLPFANMSRDADDEYFSDGLAEEIINRLAHVPNLKVTARTSAFAFRGKEQDIRKIAEVLNVRTILEGSVRRAGSRVRVTAQLINAVDGYHLWSERYDRQMEDIFAVQDEISAAITEALKLKLSPVQTGKQRHQPSLPAYEALLKAWHYTWKMTPEGLERSRAYLDEAIHLDPGFALPYTGYAHHFLQMSIFGIEAPHHAMPQMRAMAKKAFDLDLALAEAHALAGIAAAVYDYDWPEAERRFQVALGCDSVPPVVRAWFGYFHRQSTGTMGEAFAQIERAIQEDPLNYVLRFCLGSYLVHSRRYAEADEQFHEAVELAGPNFVPLVNLAMSCAAQGKRDEALQWSEAAFAVAPWSQWAIGALAGSAALTGDRARSDEVMRLFEGSHFVRPALGFTLAHMLRGELELAAESARRAIEERDPHIPMWLRHPVFDALQRSEWGPSLLKMMNLTEGQ